MPDMLVREGVVGERAPGAIARPALFERLSTGSANGLTLVCAPAGSGKTMLLRSWVDASGMGPRTAWVTVDREEHDGQRFWLALVDQVAAVADDGAIERSAPAPAFDGAAFVGRLIDSLGKLREPVVLVIDDLHELAAPETLAQLEALLTRRPPLLHVILASRHDPQLGLHRHRLAGRLTEVRAADLRFTVDEAQELFRSSETNLPDEAVANLVVRTEGWAAGLRLAALSLAGHPDPEGFVEAFSGSDRTVADYLLAEVLERQPDTVRQLLLRTSILERVNGPLADCLTNGHGSARLLLSLEEANAFVVSLDPPRTWFRYHRLFADLLRLELRRADGERLAELHLAAAGWFADHGFVLEAIGHAQAAEDWGLAARLLVDHGFRMVLDGRVASIGVIVSAFPVDTRSQPELAAFLAYWELTQHSLDDAADYISLAERRASEVPVERRRPFASVLAVARLALARRRGDLEGALREAVPLLEPDDAMSASHLVLSHDAKAVALMNLGIVEFWSFRLDDAARHLTDGLALADRLGRPYVAIRCRSHLALLAARESISEARALALRAVADADANGWGLDPVACTPLVTLATMETAQGRFDDARRWLGRAEQCVRLELEPATALLVHWVRGELDAAEGRLERAIDEFLAAERLQELLATSHVLTGAATESIAQVQLRLGDQLGARATLARLADRDLILGEARVVEAELRLAEGDPAAAVELLEEVIDGTTRVIRVGTVIQALVLDAMAREALGDAAGAEASVERALDLAEPDSLIYPFLMVPARNLLARHPRDRTRHAALLSDVLDVLGGAAPMRRPAQEGGVEERLTDSELRVLRYLPTNLTAPEIAAELYVSTTTVKTHMRHLYEKLGVHRRAAAVERARVLGLLGSTARRS